MDDRANSVRNTVALLCEHLGFDPRPVLGRMRRKEDMGQALLECRCSRVLPLGERTIVAAGTGTPAFMLVLDASERPSSIFVSVKPYRDGKDRARTRIDVCRVKTIGEGPRIEPDDGFTRRWPPRLYEKPGATRSLWAAIF